MAPSLLDFAFASSQSSIIDYAQPMDTDEELSSVNGFESPRNLEEKVRAGRSLRPAALELEAMKLLDFDACSGYKVRALEDEIEAMEAWDFDVGSARLVGVSRQADETHRGNFASPYWGAAARRSLVDGLVQMYTAKAQELSLEQHSTGTLTRPWVA